MSNLAVSLQHEVDHLRDLLDKERAVYLAENKRLRADLAAAIRARKDKP